MNKRSRLKSAIIANVIMAFAVINVFNIKVLAEEDALSSLDLGKEIIKQYYIEEVEDAKLNAASDLDSLVKSLNDPYSTYFTKEQYEEFTNSLNHSFAGIGVQIDTTKEGIKVVAVFGDTPAYKAGIEVGDIITEADGHSLAGLSTEEAVTFIRGAAGTSVNLKVKRGQATLSFTVKREQITLPTVEGATIEDHIGYIAISSFGETTAEEFSSTLEELEGENVDSYIIDLRNNPGGYMNVAFDIAGHFIGEKVVSKVQPRAGEAVNYTGTDHGKIIDKPLIFLINKYSASASEILSAAIKDNKKAFFIGENTYGKGVGQNLFNLPDGSYLKLTTFSFVSPLGNKINKVGVSPDLVIKDDFEKGIDSLEAAVILFSGLNYGEDKTGLVKVELGSSEFEIDPEVAKGEKSLPTFKYMAENVFTGDKFFVGKDTSWEKLAADTKVSDFLFAEAGEETPKTEVPAKEETPVNTETPEKVETPAKSEALSGKDAAKSEGTADKKSDEKEAAALESLPKTGGLMDFNTILSLGIILIISGMYVRKKS